MTAIEVFGGIDIAGFYGAEKIGGVPTDERREFVVRPRLQLGEGGRGGVVAESERAIAGTQMRQRVVQGAGGAGGENGVITDGCGVKAGQGDTRLIGETFLKQRDTGLDVDGAAVESPVDRIAHGAGEAFPQGVEGDLSSLATGLNEKA